MVFLVPKIKLFLIIVLGVIVVDVILIYVSMHVNEDKSCIRYQCISVHIPMLPNTAKTDLTQSWL